ncbi:putative receptor-like protein kinase-like [Dorcoceras hygrometricum]|uniref:Putative receptor-like protein kinase-like n=1 Tax=Dorcoceras hygrometricum TaxID=472368 RepID=A0A2Z7CRT6_9LAMI|nr:putative receptor-like protein kinase-like [Dorcoceras hygrometricum]
MAGVSSHVAHKISALAASCLRDEADGRRRVLRGGGWPMKAGRTLAARLPREERPRDAASGAKGCAIKRAARSTMMRLLLHTAASIVRRWADEAPLLVCDGAHWLRKLHAARCARLRAASRAAAAFSWWWRRPRPPLRRVSGDVVTALISSRVWFGPVPGSP